MKLAGRAGSTSQLVELASSCKRGFSMTVLACIYTVSRKKKSLQYFMCNFNKFKDIFIMFGKNHPETTLY